MRVLIVEDDPLVAAGLADLVEASGDHSVVAIAADKKSAVAASCSLFPDVAFVDLQLAHGSTGYEVAAALADLEIPCIFETANPPPFEMPELAVAIIEKPYRTEDVAAALDAAEQFLAHSSKNKLH